MACPEAPRGMESQGHHQESQDPTSMLLQCLVEVQGRRDRRAQTEEDGTEGTTQEVMRYSK